VVPLEIRVQSISPRDTIVSRSMPLTAETRLGSYEMQSEEVDTCADISDRVTADMTKFDQVREVVRAVHQHHCRVDGLVK
jgi:hypothetical protein